MSLVLFTCCGALPSYLTWPYLELFKTDGFMPLSSCYPSLFPPHCPNPASSPTQTPANSQHIFEFVRASRFVQSQTTVHSNIVKRTLAAVYMCRSGLPEACQRQPQQVELLCFNCVSRRQAGRGKALTTCTDGFR